MTVSVRPADDVDVAAVAAFRRGWDTDSTLSGRDLGEAPDQFEARFARWWDDEAGHRSFWLAWDGSTPVGLTGLLEYRAMPTPGLPQRRWGYLGNMYVDPAHRDAGVGSLLLQTVLAAARERGFARVVLAPSPRSVAFYARAGFVDAGPVAGRDRLMVLPLR